MLIEFLNSHQVPLFIALQDAIRRSPPTNCWQASFFAPTIPFFPQKDVFTIIFPYNHLGKITGTVPLIIFKKENSGTDTPKEIPKVENMAAGSSKASRHCVHIFVVVHCFRRPASYPVMPLIANRNRIPRAYTRESYSFICLIQ